MTDSPSVSSLKVSESGSAKKVRLLDAVEEKGNENVSRSSDTLADTPLPLPNQSDSADRKSLKTPASTKQDTTNKFDMLCDGVLSSITLVQSALADFLALKDELLLHSIPPTLMAQLAITAGKLYRSTTDMYTPITELVRMVRVYSVPWEEKSAALKKLHTDYESKHKQLNIAIRRLQLLDMQSRRIDREKRIMNWEKLFSKLTSCKGHGRRWKFLIDTFKQKAKMGMEHVQAYIDSIEKRQDDEGEPDLNPPKSRSESIVADELRISSTELDFSDGESERDEYDENDGLSTARATAQTQDFDMDEFDAPSQLSKRTHSLPRPSRGMPYRNAPHTERKIPTRETGMQTEIIGDVKPVLRTSETDSQTFVPQLVDSDVWTHEPEFDWFLNVKVYRPIGFQQQEQLRCSINYQKQFLKTDVYSTPPGTPGKEKRVKIVEPDKPGRSKSMIGSKGRTPMGRKKKDKALDEAWKDENFQHLVFKLDGEPSLEKPSLDSLEVDDETKERNVTDVKNEGSGDAPKKRKTSRVEDQIRLAILAGGFEEMLAMATIDAADLQTLEVQLKDSIEDTADQIPASFPVYPIKSSAKERQKVQTPCGTVRLTFFYTCVHKPFTFDKQTASESINEIVLDLTDIDLRLTKKENLPWNKDYRDRCLSALSLRSSDSDKPEMVTRAEFDMLIEQHNQEIVVMQEDFESRIKSLAKSIEKLQNDQLNALLNPQATDGRFGSPLHGWTDDQKTSVSNSRKPSPLKHKKLANLPKWGSDLPKDFFERLKLFNEESIRRQQELADRIKEEVSQVIERQLAGQYKLSAPVSRPADLEKDVCLPAVFMPTKTAHLYNPRAHSYFHPSGSTGRVRLTQPPSMFQLPPLPANNRMSVINLFDIRRNFEERGPTWSSFMNPTPEVEPSEPVSVQSPGILETVVSTAEEEPTRSATF